MLKYSQLVMEHFKNPRNLGSIQQPSAKATEGSIACGDMMTVYLDIQEGTIQDIRFETYGCAANIATASMMTEAVKGLSLEEAKTVNWKEIVERLGGLPEIKYHCSNLAVDTLLKAIQVYEKPNQAQTSEQDEPVSDTHS